MRPVEAIPNSRCEASSEVQLTFPQCDLCVHYVDYRWGERRSKPNRCRELGQCAQSAASNERLESLLKDSLCESKIVEPQHKLESSIPVFCLYAIRNGVADPFVEPRIVREFGKQKLT
jgi:hypothetical protein